MTKRTAGLILTIVIAASIMGCDGVTPYDENRMAPAAKVTPRREWTTGGSTGITGLELAFDGNRSTAAGTGSSYRGATLTIDLGKVCLFNMIVVDHGPEEMGFVRGIAVSTSLDGETYHKRFGGPGTREESIFSLVAPALARYVRLQVVEPGPEPWSIGEVYVR